MRRHWEYRRGFTLTELLVTLGIIVVILSISVGIMARLGKKNELTATEQAVRSLMRRGRNAAREERYGVIVEIDSVASELRAHQKAGLTQFRFEAAEVLPDPDGPPEAVPAGQRAPSVCWSRGGGARGFEMTIENSELAKGRYGKGLLFEHDRGDRVSWAHIEDRSVLSPLEGIYVEAWILPGLLAQKIRKNRRKSPGRKFEDLWTLAGEPPRPGPERIRGYSAAEPPLFTIARKGKAYALSLTANYELELALTGKDADGVEVTYITRTARDVVRPNRWYRVALAFDGRRARIIVNGIGRMHLPIETGPKEPPVRLIRDKAPLVLSDSHPDRAFYGVIDELKIAGIIRSQVVPIPENIYLIAPEKEVGFDLLGQLDPARHAEPFVLYLTDQLEARAIVEGVATDDKRSGTVSRKKLREQREQAAKQNMNLGRRRFQRFVEALEQQKLDPTRVRRIVVGRTGIVTD